MWSGGKDSSASLILCYELGIHLDAVIFSEVMYSHERNISGENPEFIAWVYDIAIPKIRDMGYDVHVVKSEYDYLSLFYKPMIKSKIVERIGKLWGFPLQGKCFVNNYCKIRPIKKIMKEFKDAEQIVGIAYDEPKRLERAYKRGQRSVLAEQKILEADTFEICNKYGLLSPTYSKLTRGGVGFAHHKRYQNYAPLEKITRNCGMN